MTTATIDLINKRISTNKFDAARTLSDERIRQLVGYASQAPSAFNLQNYRFIAVRDAASKEKLKGLAYGQPKVGEASVTFIVVGDMKGHEKLAAVLEPSVKAGFFPQEMVGGWVGMANGMYSNAQMARDEAVRSASLAAMTLMIAAESEGLASGPMIGFDPAAVSREFGLGPDEIPVMLLTVGFAAAGNWPRKPRRAAGDLVTIV